VLIKYIFFLSFFVSFFVKAQALFQPSDKTLSFEKDLELQSNPLVVSDRYHLARIDQNEIFRSINYEMPMVFNLFNDVEFRAHAQKVKELENGSSFISGFLENGGHFTLFLHKSGIIRGEIHSLQGTYTLKSEGNDFNQVLIKQKDLSGITRCGNEKETSVIPDPSVIPAKAGTHTHKSENPLSAHDWISDQVRNDVHAGNDVHVGNDVLTGVTAQAGTSSNNANNTIDVLVVYTQRVEDHVGGPEQIQAAIENEVAKMNQVLENSGLVHRQITLASMEKVDYTQATSLGADLSNLAYTLEDKRNRDYSALDEIHPMIEEHQADLVHLFVRDAVGVCGRAVAYSLSDDQRENDYCENSEDFDECLFNRRRTAWKESRRRFSVSSIKCSEGYTFTHELGHSLSLWHQRSYYTWDDLDIEYGDFPFKPYAFGYVSPDLSQNICQSTVMSFEGCPSEGIDSYITVPYFSNPDLFFIQPEGPYASRPFKADTPMGAPGDEYTIDLNGPVSAARAIDDVWGIVASLSEPGDVEPPNVNSCNRGDIPLDALTSSLDSQISLSPEGESRNMTISFVVPDDCIGVSPSVSASDSFVSASIQRIQEGEYELSITASAHASFCDSRSAQLIVGMQGVSPVRISVTQISNNELCRNIADFPLNSQVVDLSGRNSSSFQLTQGMFSRFTDLASLNLSDNKLSSFVSAVFDGLDLLTNLNLSHNEFTEIPESAFTNLLSLETLNLSKNTITEIHADAFELVPGESYRLRTLDLSHNQLQTLPHSVFSNLTVLNMLKLNNNQIGALEEDSLLGLVQLTRLNLGNNEMTHIHERAFWDNAQLTHLWLHSNKLGSVEELSENVLSSLAELEILNLSRNEIEDIPNLSNNVRLRSLWLYDNQVSELSSNTFSSLSDLRIIQLNQNTLTTLPSNIFQDNPHLEQLHLSSNEISSLPSDIFSGLSRLKSLSLSKNQLTEMPNLSGLSELVNLWLYSNQISALFRSALSGLSNLKSVDLSRNQISRIESGAFSDLSQATHLRLYDNQISDLLPSTFDGLSNVVFLTLSRNNITRLSDDVFSRMPNLKSLWIHSNQIRSISPDAFSGLSQLEYLNISYNPIQGPLPAEVCDFIKSVPKAHMNGIDMNVICPQ